MAFSEQDERAASASAVGGMWDAKLYIASPAILALMISWMFGEGDYLVAVIAASYGILLVYGEWMRRQAKPQSRKRFKALWIIWASIFCFAGFGLLSAVVLSG